MHTFLSTFASTLIMLHVFSFAPFVKADDEQATTSNNIAIAIHGGAGTISKANLSPAQEAAYREILEKALKAGYEVLKSGEDGTVAVIKAIQLMEDSVLFNAGVGAVYTFDEEHELDASIMHGADRSAGAVAGVKTIRSPIAAANLVRTESVHVLLSGEGAESFAFAKGLEKVDNRYFNSSRRLDALKKAKKEILKDEQAFYSAPHNIDYKYGTVGVVVLDKNGNLVAGTSTGGMTAKRYGRVGDSPIIGAGTFADNNSCAVSSTGHGEFFIRYNVAADICARVEYQQLSIEDAASKVINGVLKDAGGTGGVIAIDAQGNIAMPFNTEGMYRASIDTKGDVYIGIYGND
ncbi:isoaspartyl peptidase/L-asparaginase [Glaciecola sp. MH2013]|uniref:isoaspartyl peptidase/L-asparaginase family protein n=1 Tax=Glaciecola sp. MH2013 TaxID=2785524 RepID=UPI00189D6E50|nr:isoaspartyl peptidase/L-asparaginase [Glaciecola sp. MH2013]MBF7072936.1 isoaspartyl peptidase/L-asparaginase [Glaciecola sp. MH2013]